MHPWLQTVRHDLVKRAVWPARDLGELGGQDVEALRRGLAELTDSEGAPVTAIALWHRLRKSATAGCGKACDAFESALQAAASALDRPWPAPLDAVLALEDAFADLARAVDELPEK